MRDDDGERLLESEATAPRMVIVGSRFIRVRQRTCDSGRGRVSDAPTEGTHELFDHVLGCSTQGVHLSLRLAKRRVRDLPTDLEQYFVLAREAT